MQDADSHVVGISDAGPSAGAIAIESPSRPNEWRMWQRAQSGPDALHTARLIHAAQVAPRVHRTCLRGASRLADANEVKTGLLVALDGAVLTGRYARSG